jgi:hypothetical protein
MLGTCMYRTAPPTPRFTSELNVVISLKYFVGAQGRRVRRDLAKKRHEAGRLAACRHPSCNAILLTTKSGNLKVRLHNAHELRASIEEARRLDLGSLLENWREAKLKPQRCWAQAIELANARSEEA